MTPRDGSATPARLHEVLEPAPADRPALIHGDTTSTFGELRSLVAAVRAAVERTTAPGDRVAVLSDNRPEVLALLLGVPAAGRILVPLNTRLAPAENRALLDEAEAAVLLGEASHLEPLGPRTIPVVDLDTGFADWLGPAGGDGAATERRHDVGAPVDPEAPAWLIFTSGTTGRPKGALLSHRGLLAACSNAEEARGVGPDDVYLFPFPLFHVAAYNVVHVLRAGRPVVLLRRFEPVAVLDACRRHGVTQMSLAPTMVTILLDHPDHDPAALATVERMGYGASPMPLDLLRRILDETGLGLSQGYGMTELSGNVAYLDVDDHRAAAADRPHLLASAGRPAGDNRIRVVDERREPVGVGETGEIEVRGPQVMLGYWRRPDVTAETVVDGWLRTGDLGRFDADGYLYVVDRRKDVIVSGGENVSSREVEDVVGTHPSIARVAVVGAPDPTWGETVVAVVVPVGGTTIDADDVVAHTRRRLAGYKSPRRIVVVDDLPVNANGKVDKVTLRALVRGD